MNISRPIYDASKVHSPTVHGVRVIKKAEISSTLFQNLSCEVLNEAPFHGEADITLLMGRSVAVIGSIMKKK